MTDKILIDRELLDEFRRYTEAGVPQKGSWGYELLLKLRAALDAPKQEAVAWYCDCHGYTDNKDDAESWRDRGMPVTEYYLHPAPSVPEGWQLVPKEPTSEMYQAVPDLEGEDDEIMAFKHIYRAMLSAAPKVSTTDDRKDAERYRWLRKNSVFSWDKSDDLALVVPGDTNSYNYEDDADVAIDAAIAAQKGEKE